MAATHGILLFELRQRSVAQLPDGTLTLDVAAARRVKRAAEIQGNPGARPLSPSRSETPARLEALDRLVKEGLIEEGEADSFIHSGRVPDESWARLRELVEREGKSRPAPGPPKVSEMWCWFAELHTGSGQNELDFDPLQHTSAKLPLESISRVLDDLSTEGWRVLDVSEDRAVDPSSGSSYVVALRYLLTRP